MSKLVLVTREGLVLSNNEPSKVEKHEVITLHAIAAREAAKASTQKDTNKQS